MFEILERLNIFSDVKYYDKDHHYEIRGQRVSKSATKLIGNAETPFDKENISAAVARKRGVTQQVILDEWSLNAKKSTEKGTVFHSYAENYLANRVFPYPKERILAVPEFKGVDYVAEPMQKLVPMFHRFVAENMGTNLIPVRSEFVLGDLDLDIAGMIDQLVYSRASGCLHILDWKTNKAIETENKYGTHFRGALSYLEQCEFIKYSLQLSIYKYLIEKHIKLRLGPSYLVWFFEGNETYQVIPTADMEVEAKYLLGVCGADCLPVAAPTKPSVIEVG